MDTFKPGAQPVPTNDTARGTWDQGMERGFKKQCKDVWEKLDPMQKYSMYVILGMAGILLILMIVFGVKDFLV